MKKSISQVSCFVIFIAFLMSMRCWIGFENRSTLFFYALPVLLIILQQAGKLCFLFTNRAVVFSLLLYAVRLYFSLKAVGSLNISGIINQAFLPISVLMILSIIDEQKKELLQYIVKWLGYIFVIGIVIHFVNSFVHLPSLGIIRTHYGGSLYGADCYNYMFCIELVQAEHNGLFRFSGPFIEPGDFGCVCAFLLYATRFDFKKYKNLKYILLAVIVSLSLGGYILTGFAYALYLSTQKRLSGKLFFGGVVLVLALYLFGSFYNGGNNIINTSILSRLQEAEFSSDATNGRTTAIKMAAYLEMWDNSELLWNGYDAGTVEVLNEEGNGLGSGYTNIVIEAGLLGLIGILLPYLYMTITSNEKRYSWLLFVLLIILLFDRSDLFWLSYIICYSYGIILYEHDHKKLSC